MSFLTVSKTKEDVVSSGNNKYINSSGMHEVNILNVFFSYGEQESASLNFFVEHEDQKQVIYSNLTVTNKDGSANEIGRKTLNQLLVIADLEDTGDIIEEELNIGKNGDAKVVDILENLTDIPAIMRVQMSYSKYKGKIYERKQVKGFYRLEDKASASEIALDQKIGEQYEKDIPYSKKDNYRDGLTAEDVANFLASKTGKKSETKEPTKKKLRFGK